MTLTHAWCVAGPGQKSRKFLSDLWLSTVVIKRHGAEKKWGRKLQTNGIKFWFQIDYDRLKFIPILHLSGLSCIQTEKDDDGLHLQNWPCPPLSSLAVASKPGGTCNSTKGLSWIHLKEFSMPLWGNPTIRKCIESTITWAKPDKRKCRPKVGDTTNIVFSPSTWIIELCAG